MTGLRQLGVIISYDLSRRWRSLIIWAVALGALGALYVALFPMMQASFKDIPPEAQKYFGDIGTLTIGQWLDMEFLNSTAALALPFLVIIIGARTIAGNEDRRALDLLLSNPLRRRQLVFGSVGTMALSLAGILIATWIFTYVAVLFAGVDIGPGRVAQGIVTVWPFCLVLGTFALLLSAVLRRAWLAIVIPAVIMVVMLVIDGLAQAIDSLHSLRVVSLFYLLGTPFEGDFPWTAVLVMLAATCALTVAAVELFARRDIYT